MPVVHPEALIENRVTAIRDFHDSVRTKRAELDVSGGLDSAVMLGLLSKALGPENVTAVYQGINSSPESLERAREAAEVFGVRLVEIDLTTFVEPLILAMVKSLVAAGYDEDAIDELIGDDPTVLGSIRSCLRAPIGRGFNRLTEGGIRHGTGNECEDRWMRFFQKGGDGEVDTNPIAMLSKGETFQLAKALGVPRSILTARPTPDLWGTGDDHNDEDEIGQYLGFKASDYGQTFYSYIDPDTGEYIRVGLIERVSRFADSNVPHFGQGVFLLGKTYLPDIIHGAQNAVEFAGIDPDLTRKLIRAAKRVELMTRHKFNPNIPTLGDRDDLVAAGILTNTLPTFGGNNAFHPPLGNRPTERFL